MRTRVAGVLVVLLGAGAADAHHAFSPVYDGSRTVTVEGVVKSFKFVNPHASMVVDVPDQAGNVVQWIVEFDGRLNLENGGWTQATIPVNARIAVTGNPSRAGSPRMFFVLLKQSDGTMVRRPALDRIEAVDQDRQRRIQERSQQPSQN
jgi:hypothetical protein